MKLVRIFLLYEEEEKIVEDRYRHKHTKYSFIDVKGVLQVYFSFFFRHYFFLCSPLCCCVDNNATFHELKKTKKISWYLWIRYPMFFERAALKHSFIHRLVLHILNFSFHENCIGQTNERNVKHNVPFFVKLLFCFVLSPSEYVLWL